MSAAAGAKPGGACWIGPDEFTRGEIFADLHHPVVLLADLTDERLKPFLQLDPTPQDLSDGQRNLAGPRKWFLARRSLLRHMVGLAADCDAGAVRIGHDPQGAPRVDAGGAEIFVSVSARGQICALALCGTPVGVDLERIDQTAEPVWHVLHDSERGPIERKWRELGSDLLFRKTWIAKEAWLKALGCGLNRDPASFGAEIGETGEFRIVDAVSFPQPVGAWAVREICGLKFGLACIARRRIAEG